MFYEKMQHYHLLLDITKILLHSELELEIKAVQNCLERIVHSSKGL